MRQFINTRLSTTTPVVALQQMPIGSVIHQSGCFRASNTALTINGVGFYRIIVNATVEPSAVADMVLSLNANNVTIASATEAPAVADDPVNLTLIGVVSNRCGCSDNVISVVAGSAGSVTEMDIIIERI